MNKIKGIVVEQTEKQVVILSPDGRFIRGEAEGQELGSESWVSPVRSKRSLRLVEAGRNPVLAVTVIAAALLIMFSALFLPYREPALAFIQLEVNPAVEFGIDSDGIVRELTPLNGDGLVLIREFGDWDGKKVTELLGRIFDQFGESDRELTVTSVAGADEKLTATLDRTVRFIRDTAGEEGMTLSLSEADREMRDRAKTAGVPISRLLSQDDQSGEPPTAGQEKKKLEEAEEPSPAEDSRKPDEEPGPDTTEESARRDNNTEQAPGIGKKEASPAESGTHGEPGEIQKPPVQSKGEGQKNRTGGPPANDHDGMPKGSGKPDKASPSPGKSEQDQKKDGPAGVSPPDKSVSPGQGHQTNAGEQNKKSGNGKGGNGNGSGN